MKKFVLKCSLYTLRGMMSFIYFFIRKTIYKKMLKYIDFFNIS